MKIHRAQAKQILARCGVPVPDGWVCSSPAEARDFANTIGGPVVVKARSTSAGRGKAGGIKVAHGPAEAQWMAREMLGSRLKGLTVEKVLVERAIDIAEEYYLGITVDRSARRNVVMVSAVGGGFDIEQVAVESPDKITRLHIDPSFGLMDFQVRRVAYDAGLGREVAGGVTKFLNALYTAYVGSDASLAEINPLALTTQGQLVAANAKIDIDDNALFRHPEFEEYRDDSEEDSIDAELPTSAESSHLRLDGDIESTWETATAW